MKPDSFIACLRFETRDIVDSKYPKRIVWLGIVFERFSGYTVSDDGVYSIRYRPELNIKCLPDAIPCD